MAKVKKSGEFDKIRKIIEKDGSKIHFVGIGGVSMYSLARLSLLASDKVSGSDCSENHRVSTLISLGADVKIGHEANNITDQDLVVYTHAVKKDNPELLAAEKKKIPVVSRADYLGALMTEYETRIGISGTHGKSTTVAMIDMILAFASKDHTTLSGAALVPGEPFRAGGGDLLLYEACEYKDSFLKFHPTIAVALNLEFDHPDYFKNVEAIKDSFIKSLSRAKVAIVNRDDSNIFSILRKLKGKCELITVGGGFDSDYSYKIKSFNNSGFKFCVEYCGEDLGDFELNVPGAYNVSNAIFAIAVARKLGINLEVIKHALASFNGISGRMERLGNFEGREVFADYAHHPTAIRATVNALKMYTKDNITVVFKPHTYSRTKSLLEEFVNALSLADHVIMTDIYAAREEPIDGITSERLASLIGSKAVYCPDSMVKEKLSLINHGVIVLMGAGDMEGIRKELFDHER